VAADTPTIQILKIIQGAVVLRGLTFDALPDDPDDLADALTGPCRTVCRSKRWANLFDGFTGGRLPPKHPSARFG